jgi:hypothetical protein
MKDSGYTYYMKKSYLAVIIILIAIIGYLVYDKLNITQVTVQQEQKQVPAQNATQTPQATAPESNTTNHDCLISAETFFEKKRAGDVDLLGADWDAHFEASSGICFVQFTTGAIYDVTTGDAYRLQGSTYVKTK